jgi:hypothetical protein
MKDWGPGTWNRGPGHRPATGPRPGTQVSKTRGRGER